MTQQPEALRLAEWLDHYGDKRTHSDAASELRLLYEVNKAFGKRQEWWNDRMVEMENALRQAVEAMESVYGYEGKKCETAITAAKQALGEKK